MTEAECGWIPVSLRSDRAPAGPPSPTHPMPLPLAPTASNPGATRGMALVGSGRALPAASISNDDLSQRVATDDDWIRSRTGLGPRRLAGPGAVS